VKRLSQIASADTKFYRFIRSPYFSPRFRTPWIRRRIAASFAGLDHKLPGGWFEHRGEWSGERSLPLPNTKLADVRWMRGLVRAAAGESPGFWP
jgi:hypothetical protein